MKYLFHLPFAVGYGRRKRNRAVLGLRTDNVVFGDIDDFIDAGIFF